MSMRPCSCVRVVMGDWGWGLLTRRPCVNCAPLWPGLASAASADEREALGVWYAAALRVDVDVVRLSVRSAPVGRRGRGARVGRARSPETSLLSPRESRRSAHRPNVHGGPRRRACVCARVRRECVGCMCYVRWRSGPVKLFSRLRAFRWTATGLTQCGAVTESLCRRLSHSRSISGFARGVRSLARRAAGDRGPRGRFCGPRTISPHSGIPRRFWRPLGLPLRSGCARLRTRDAGGASLLAFRVVAQRQSFSDSRRPPRNLFEVPGLGSCTCGRCPRCASGGRHPGAWAGRGVPRPLPPRHRHRARRHRHIANSAPPFTCPHHRAQKREAQRARTLRVPQRTTRSKLRQ
jgi:hypothetical protein